MVGVLSTPSSLAIGSEELVFTLREGATMLAFSSDSCSQPTSARCWWCWCLSNPRRQG